MPDARAGSRRSIPDLRAVLLAEGVALARAGGPEAVSLRDVQRRAGVSNSAAYRHFADRAALLAAISEHAAQQMADRMLAAIAAGPATGSESEQARARFRATGLAYLDFAVTEPGLFAVAFQHHEAADPAGAPPFQLLRRCLDDLVDTGTLAPAHRPHTDIAAWAAVHGLAVLLDGPLRDLPADAREAAIRRLLEVIDGGTR